MSNSDIDRMVRVLRELRELYPDWRIGQLVANVAAWAKGPTDSAVWDMSDEEFIRTAEEHVRRLRNSHDAVTVAKKTA